MLLLSTGFTCGTFFSNELTLRRGTMITVPESADGSIRSITFSSAMIDAYSVPCAPETSASTGPGFAPFATTTGILSAASTPAGTSIVPYAFCPGAAVALPTVNATSAARIMRRFYLLRSAVMKRLFFLLLIVPCAFAQTVFVDATDARRGVFHSHVTLPVKSGPMTFVYPKWIPGEHTPTGPLMQLAGLHVRAGGAEIPWSRDRVEVFEFHVHVPEGVQSIDVDFDYLSPSSTFGAGYGESANATQNLLLILFNHIIVYPSAAPTDQLRYRASVRLPDGWKFDTALPVAAQNGDHIDFAPVSLTTLVDSPIVAGAFMRTIPITDTAHVTVTADSSSALAMSDARIAQMRNLVAETDALFGARHYRTYRWLVTLSDLVEIQGLA